MGPCMHSTRFENVKCCVRISHCTCHFLCLRLVVTLRRHQIINESSSQYANCLEHIVGAQAMTFLKEWNIKNQILATLKFEFQLWLVMTHTVTIVHNTHRLWHIHLVAIIDTFSKIYKYAEFKFCEFTIISLAK